MKTPSAAPGSTYRTLLVLCISAAFSLGLTTSADAGAIPAWARKYKTSCGTCHSIYPKLNSFGETFRQNGFIFPEGEEEKVKEEPVELGSPAYKRVWPDAVWPSSIPGVPPIALRGRMGFTYEKDGGTSFSQFGQPALQFLGAGTMGENITIFVGAHLYEDGETGSIDRFYIKLDNMFSNVLPNRLLYLRIGQFIPEIVTFASNHRGLTETAFGFNTYAPSQGSSFSAGHAHGAGPFGIETFQLGIEASGIVSSRARYVLGFVNGNGQSEDNNKAKDGYARLSYKIGGLAFDGTGPQEASSSGAFTYENSITFGAFGYKGIGVHDGRDADFFRAGFDVNLNFKKLNLFGGYIFGEDEDGAEQYDLYFAEADFLLYPWLMGILRYEVASPNGIANAKRLIPNITALYVANIKFMVETRLDADDIDFNNLFVGMDFAF